MFFIANCDAFVNKRKANCDAVINVIAQIKVLVSILGLVHIYVKSVENRVILFWFVLNLYGMFKA